MKRKIIAIILFTFFSHTGGYAQLSNYSIHGKHKTNLSKEKIELKVTTLTEEKQSVGAISLGLLTAAINPALKIGKTYLDKRAESYVGAYTGTLTDDTLNFRESLFEPFELEITRNTFERQDSTPTVASKIVLLANRRSNEPLFRFKLKEVQMEASKARIRKSNSKNIGRTVDLNIEVQVLVHYLDELKPADAAAGNPEKITYKIKTSTLGSSSINIRGIKPNGHRYDFSQNEDNSLFSGWFQVIPDLVLSEDLRKRLSDNRNVSACWTTIQVTVKEANPYGISTTKLAEYFGNSEEGIAEFLKALIPSKDEKE